MSLKVTQPEVATGVGDITDRVGLKPWTFALPGRVGIIGEEGLVQVKALGFRKSHGFG